MKRLSCLWVLALALSFALPPTAARAQDAARPTLTVAQGHRGAFIVSAFSPDSSLLATAADGREIRVWETKSGLLLRAIPLPAGYTFTQTMQGDLFHAVFSLDNRYLCASMQGPDGQGLCIWDLQTGGVALALRPVDENGMMLGMVDGMAFLPDGKTLVLQSMSILRYYAFPTGKYLSAYGQKENQMVQTMALSPDGHYLAAYYNGTDPALPQVMMGCKVWDAKTATLLYTLDGTKFYPGTLHFSADSGQLISTAMFNGQTTVADMATGTIYAPIMQGVRPPMPWVLTPYNNIYGAFTPDKITFYRADSPDPVWELGNQPGTVKSAAVSPDGKYLAFNTQADNGDASLQLWALKEKEQRWQREARGATIWGLTFAPSGKMLAVEGSGMHVQLLSLSSGNVVKRFSPPEYDYDYAALSPDGKWAAFAGPAHAELLIQDTKTADVTYRVTIGKQPHARLFFSADSQYLLASTGDLFGKNGPQTKIRAIGLKDGAVAWEKDGWALGSGPDGKAAAAYLAKQGGLRLLDVATGAEQGMVSSNSACALLAATPTNRTMVGVNAQGYNVWQLPQPKPALAGGVAHKGTAERLMALGLSPKQPLMALGCESGNIHLLSTDPKNAGAPRELAGDGTAVTALAFSPDGKLLASGTQDGRVLLWDLDAGKILLQWQLFPVTKASAADLNWLATTPDGYLLCGDATKALLGWLVDGKLQAFSEQEKTWLNPDKVKEALKRP